MIKPLALIYYEKLMPGSRLVTRLQDLGYRVQTVSNPASLSAEASAEKPLVVLVELTSQRENLCAEVRKLRQDESTGHIPVLAFSDQHDAPLQKAAFAAGVTLVAAADGVMAQLPQLLEQVLQVD